jgi:hypothetical protein
MPFQSHPPWLDYCNYIWQRVQVLKLLSVQFSPTLLILYTRWANYNMADMRIYEAGPTLATLHLGFWKHVL